MNSYSADASAYHPVYAYANVFAYAHVSAYPQASAYSHAPAYAYACAPKLITELSRLLCFATYFVNSYRLAVIQFEHYLRFMSYALFLLPII